MSVFVGGAARGPAWNVHEGVTLQSGLFGIGGAGHAPYSR